MFPTDFDESNIVFDKPPDMTRDECDPINVASAVDSEGNPILVTCWKPTAEELEEINRTGRIWCLHWGTQLQPHSLAGTNPFK